MNRHLVAILLATALLAPASVRADEVVHLLDNTKITGKLLHYYEGMLHLKIANGTTLQLPAAKVKRVEFALPKPRAALSSPKKTFERMRKAALKGDLETYIDCHSSYYQIYINHQVMVMGAKKFVASLKKEWGNLRIEVLKSTVKGNTALMKVRRIVGERSQEGELRFVRENKEWKMILPI